MIEYKDNKVFVKKNYYEILNLSLFENKQEIILSSYNKCIIKYSKRNTLNSKIALADVIEAYFVLSDPKVKEQYDYEYSKNVISEELATICASKRKKAEEVANQYTANGPKERKIKNTIVLAKKNKIVLGGIFFLLLLAIILIVRFCCKSETSLNNISSFSSNCFTVNGVSFEMIPVEGGTFTMGATPEQGDNVFDREKPTHQVTLSSYSIGKTEVTQALWVAVMGNNPSKFKGDDLPVEYVSWDDCQEFIKKLNQLTGQNFRLPTEAEWEFAARGGNKSKGYKYAGSNNIDEVAWYGEKKPGSTHPVGTKRSNELGIYDMSGNVYEWCQDWYGNYSSSAQTNPQGPNTGSLRVGRGGSWFGDMMYCRVSDRYNFYPYDKGSNLGFRLCLSKDEDNDIKIQKEEESLQHEFCNFSINGVSFEMIPVEGGTFTMGATAEQGGDADNDEKPTHQVTLSSYSIGKTEVTQALWVAVMGNNPSKFKGDNLPVERVSWDDCQEFIKKLNQITGQNFRLPTEAEWEFAARGGNKSKGYKYAGSNNIDKVAWYGEEKSGFTHSVATKRPNELGIYDMSGNVYEWCQDWHGNYSSSAQTNPQGPSTGSFRVGRGGSWFGDMIYCRVSDRYNFPPYDKGSNLGFRLCLSKDENNDIKIQKEKESLQHEPCNFSINGVSFEMIPVEGSTFTMGATAEQSNDAYDWEKPIHQVTLSSYSIGKTEVTQALWKAVMGSNPSYFKGDNLPVENVSWEDCQAFIKKLNQITGQNFRLPTEAEWEFAARGGKKSKGYKYTGSDNISDVAWYDSDSDKQTHPVATKQPNELGIYDMSGNVWEWCQDWYGKYSLSSQTNPKGPNTGSYRVGRGGGWGSFAGGCRVSSREFNLPNYGCSDFGFRLCL